MLSKGKTLNIYNFAFKTKLLYRHLCTALTFKKNKLLYKYLQKGSLQK